MDLLLSCSLFVCLGAFLTHSVTHSVKSLETKIAAYKETAGCSMNSSRFPMLPSCQLHFCSFNDNILAFTAAVTICYDLACHLCVLTFLDVSGICIRVTEFSFE